MEKYKVDVLIIGAGAVGVAIARELSKLSLETMVVDRLNDVGGDASKSNSAIIHCGFDAPPGSLESEMVVNANPMYDKLCKDLEIPFNRTGAILVATTETEEMELPHIMEKARANHVYDLEYLSAKQVRELEPSVSSNVRAGIFVPRESIIDPFILVVAQAENAAKNGTVFLTNCEIIDLTYRADGFEAESAEASISSRFVVNAAGLFSDRISGFLGIDDFKMHPRRGQFHILDRNAPLGIEHIILPVPTKITKGKILAPTIHGNWLIGPTAEELEDKSAHQTTREGLDEIVPGVKKLVPSIDTKYTITQYAGLRPVRSPGGYHIRTFDNLPGYLELSGIRSTGLTSSIAVAQYAGKMLAKMGMSKKKKITYHSKRRNIPSLRNAAPAEREKLVKQNPLYGHIICRCETVSEAEIVEAIKRNPGARDLDGVKRRVRAGLGRCQGGFCGMRIPKILSRELEVPIENISKKGPRSELLIGATKSLRKTSNETN